MRAVVHDDGFAWFGFNWNNFLTRVVFGSLMIGVAAAPMFILACVIADRIRTRSVMLYCAMAIASGSLWFWIFIAIIGTEDGATQRATFEAALPTIFSAAISAGLVQWMTSERTRPFPE